MTGWARLRHAVPTRARGVERFPGAIPRLHCDLSSQCWAGWVRYMGPLPHVNCASETLSAATAALAGQHSTTNGGVGAGTAFCPRAHGSQRLHSNGGSSEYPD